MVRAAADWTWPAICWTLAGMRRVSGLLWLAWLAAPAAGGALLIGPPAAPPAQARAEFRLTGVPATTNAFDPEVIAVDAVFTAPSGRSTPVPAFWYQAYVRSLVNGNESLTPAGPPEWRLRFTPAETGPYTVAVTVRTNGPMTALTASTNFVVAAASGRTPVGVVQVAASRRYFETSAGDPLPLVGHCVCWYHNGGTFDYDTWFGAMQPAGENYTRLWMWPTAFGLEEEPGTLTRYRLDRAWQLDYVLQLAEQRGIYVMLCLDFHGMLQIQPDYWGGDNYWPTNPYNTAQGGPCATPDDFFTSAAAMTIYQKRLRYLVARYGASEHLLAWELFNEIDNEYDHLTPAHVAAWHATIGDWLKANDPFHHLVTTSLTGGSDRPDLWSLPQMDFAMFHAYGQPQPVTALAQTNQSFVTRYGKPLMIGEYGTDWQGWNPQNDPFLRGWRQGIWGGALGGSVGTAMSWWWEAIQASNLYPTYGALTNFMAKTQWGRGVWQPLGFQTTGEPPFALGPPLPGASPFAATLTLSSVWGAILKGQLAIATPFSSTLASADFDCFFQGTGHPDLRIPFQLQAWLTNSARLVMHLNSVSDGAVLAVFVDGKSVFSTNLPNLDGTWQVNNEYNEDIPVNLPAGKHTIVIRNTGGDWFYLDWVRLENVLPSSYAPDWQPSPPAIGLRGDTEMLIYAVNPLVNFPANATNAAVEPSHGASLSLTNLPAGHYRAQWFDPKSARPVGETSGTSDGTLLVLPLPDFTEDLAGRLTTFREFSLAAPAVTNDGHFRTALVGEAGQSYSIEATGDFQAWSVLTNCVGATNPVPVIDPAPMAGARFYRARLVP